MDKNVIPPRSKKVEVVPLAHTGTDSSVPVTLTHVRKELNGLVTTVKL